MKKILNLLTICAISLLFLTTAHAAPINLAPNGIATQSSDYGPRPASRAIDGNTDGYMRNGSVTHTENELAWWQVDLGGEFDLGSLVLWNRTDAKTEVLDRLSNFHVSVMDNLMDEVWGQDYFTDGGSPTPRLDILLPDSTIAQFVKIQLNSINKLSLAEVQVFESSVAPEPLSSVLFITGGALLGLRFFSKKE